VCQPAWRDQNDNHPRPLTLTQVNQDWAAVLVGGNNGVICIVMSLYWWGMHLSESSVDNLADDWLEAVLDVNAVFSACLHH